MTLHLLNYAFKISAETDQDLRQLQPSEVTSRSVVRSVLPSQPSDVTSRSVVKSMLPSQSSDVSSRSIVRSKPEGSVTRSFGEKSAGHKRQPPPDEEGEDSQQSMHGPERRDTSKGPLHPDKIAEVRASFSIFNR